jgi:O-acetylhomoserine/O-acetylserine sulfhydrylase-like pyridoxal-dependent enzyme
MAAISSSLLALLKNGEHVIAHDCLYGGTRSLFTHDLPAFGITTTFVDGSRPDTFRAALTPQTRLFYVEALTNPLLELIDLDAVVAFAKEHGSCWATGGWRCRRSPTC